MHSGRVRRPVTAGWMGLVLVVGGQSHERRLVLGKNIAETQNASDETQKARDSAKGDQSDDS